MLPMYLLPMATKVNVHCLHDVVCAATASTIRPQICICQASRADIDVKGKHNCTDKYLELPVQGRLRTQGTGNPTAWVTSHACGLRNTQHSSSFYVPSRLDGSELDQNLMLVQAIDLQVWWVGARDRFSSTWQHDPLLRCNIDVWRLGWW